MPDLLTKLEDLDQRELDYVYARSDTRSDKAAYEKINRKWFFKLPNERREELNSIALELRRTIGLRAKMILSENTQRAAQIKVEGLDYRDPRLRQAAATEILDRMLGKPSQALTLFESQQQEQKEPTTFTIPALSISPGMINVYRDILNHGHSEYVFRGGRGSTKSSFISEVMIELLINNPTWHGLVVRQVKDTLRDSVYSQLVWAIDYLDLSDQFRCTTSPLEITYLPTDQRIYFRGGDDPLKIKSIKPRFGYIGLLWFEELDQFRGPETVRSIIQSAIRGGDVSYIFKSFNPPRSKSNWALRDLEIPKPNQLVHESTYLTVPPEWLGRSFLDEAEFLKEVNYPAYENEYLGIANSLGGIVFENVSIETITDQQIEQFDHVLHGLDWGYYPDPAHYCRVHYDAARRTLYVFGEIRKWKTSNRELYDSLVESGLTPEDTLIADSAEPKSIADFRDYGAACRGAEKGPESVRYSMKWLQSLVKIVVDPKRAPYAAEEMLHYEYESDRDGNYISEYPDLDNHAIDSIRYATNMIWRRRGQ